MATAHAHRRCNAHHVSRDLLDALYATEHSIAPACLWPIRKLHAAPTNDIAAKSHYDAHWIIG